MRVAPSAVAALAFATTNIVVASLPSSATGFAMPPRPDRAGSLAPAPSRPGRGALRVLTRPQDSSSSSSSVPSSSSSSSGGPSSARAGGRSAEEIAAELSSGVALDGGPVVDFGSVRDDTSNAERALATARARYLAHLNGTGASGLKVSGMGGAGDRLMGINDEVTKEVGREVGAFVVDGEDDGGEAKVQRCAEHLRSLAPPGLFSSSSSSPSAPPPLSPEEIAEAANLLRLAYDESGLVTEAFAKTFYLGTQLLPPEARKAVWAVYVWCRRTDEIVDAPRSPSDPDMLTDLSAWEHRLENLWSDGTVVDVLDLPLLDVRIQYPQMSIEPFLDMIRGMLMDIPDLGQDRYDSWDELHLYCYRVAGTVGLMCLPIFGCAPGYSYDDAKEPALSLGVAFQITNILRDVGEDATQRGRVYLPRADMERFGVTEEQLFSRRVDGNYVNLMKFEIDRAREYYRRAKRGVPMLASHSRLPVQSSLDCYGMILDKIEENGYDSLNQRAYVSKWEKMAEIPSSWYRTLEISKTFPLPGDERD